MWLVKVLEIFVIIALVNGSDQNFEIKSYQVMLSTNIHLGNSLFTGNATINFKMTETSEVIKFYHQSLTDFNVDVRNGIGVSVNINLNLGENFIEIQKESNNFTEGLTYSAVIIYSGNLPEEFIGHYLDPEDESTKNYFAAISFKSTPFTSIFPSAGDNARIKFQLSIKHFSEYHAVSNGNLLSIDDDADDRKVSTFDNVLNIDTSSIAFFISNFDFISNDETKIYGTPSHISGNFFNDTLEISSSILEKFDALFSYQLGKLIQIAVPGIFVNDLSTHGLILYNEFNVFYRDDLSPREKRDKISHHVAFVISVSIKVANVC